MADDPTPQETPEQPETGEPEAPKQDVPPEVKTALRKANKEAETLRLRLKEFEDRDKSETERLSGERDNLKGENGSLAQENLRLRVAIEKELPAELIDRLKGESKEEMEADADQLLELVKAPAKREGFDGGARPPADPKVEPGLPRLAHAYGEADRK